MERKIKPLVSEGMDVPQGQGEQYFHVLLVSSWQYFSALHCVMLHHPREGSPRRALLPGKKKLSVTDLSSEFVLSKTTSVFKMWLINTKISDLSEKHKRYGTFNEAFPVKCPK